VANGGIVAATNITLGVSNGSSGTLNIGALGANNAAGTVVAGSISGGAGTGTVNFNQSDSVTITSRITGANLSLNQLGAGTTTLTASNSYAGGTTLNAGTLAISNSSPLGTGTVTFASNGATVAPLANMRLTNTLAVNADGTINVGSGLVMTNSGMISGTGNPFATPLFPPEKHPRDFFVTLVEIYCDVLEGPNICVLPFD